MKSPSLLSTLLLLVGFISRWSPGQGSRILIVPGFVRSHQSILASIAEELLKREHEVYVYIGEGTPAVGRLEQLPVTMLKYRCDDSDLQQKFQNVFYQVAINAIEKTADTGTLYSTTEEIVSQECDRLLSDEEQLVAMEELNFDLAIVYDFFLFRCFFLVPHRLGVPFISVVDHPEPWLLRLPWLPSAVPFRLFPLTEEMTFSGRLRNTLFQLTWVWTQMAAYPSENIVERYQTYGEFNSLNDISKHSLLYLITSDYHLDYALPMMPFMIQVPGLTIVPHGQLSAEYTNILDQSPDGAILASFGTIVPTLPERTVAKLTAAFASVNQTIIWRFNNVHGLSTSRNVLIREWLPQNQLLAHPKVKLFITHGGNNGQHEALYYGVPMIAFPFFTDQPYNSLRLQRKGFGIAMDISTFTSDELVTNINKVINDPSYKTAIGKASKMFRDRPESSAQKAAFWIEHVIEYGADHLHSYSQYMPWYQFLMLDIAAFSLMVLLALGWIVRKLFSCITSLCCSFGKRKVD